MKQIAAILSIVAIVLPQVAIAQSAPFSTPHKWTNSATSKTYVYIPNQTPGVSSTNLKTFKNSTVNLALNNCGWGSFKKSVTSPPVIIAGANWAGKTTGTAPTCVKDAAPALTYTTSNPAATGAVVDDGTKIWVRGGTDLGSISIQVTNESKITTKANACGFVRVTVGTSRPMSIFAIGIVSYTIADLALVDKPMVCQKVGTTSLIYVPAN